MNHNKSKTFTDEENAYIKQCLIIMLRFFKETKSFHLFKRNFHEQHQCFENLYYSFFNNNIENWWVSCHSSFTWEFTKEKGRFWNVIYNYWGFLVSEGMNKIDYKFSIFNSIKLFREDKSLERNQQLEKDLDNIVTTVEKLLLNEKTIH